MRGFTFLATVLACAATAVFGLHLQPNGLVPASGYDLGLGFPIDWSFLFGISVGFFACWLIALLPGNRRPNFGALLFPILWAAYLVYAGIPASGGIGVAVSVTFCYLIGVLFPYRPAVEKNAN